MENKHSSIVIRITATLGKCREGNNAKAKCYFPANTSNESRKRTLMSTTTTPFFTFFLLQVLWAFYRLKIDYQWLWEILLTFRYCRTLKNTNMYSETKCEVMIIFEANYKKEAISEFFRELISSSFLLTNMDFVGIFPTFSVLHLLYYILHTITILLWRTVFP